MYTSARKMFTSARKMCQGSRKELKAHKPQRIAETRGKPICAEGGQFMQKQSVCAKKHIFLAEVNIILLFLHISLQTCTFPPGDLHIFGRRLHIYFGASCTYFCRNDTFLGAKGAHIFESVYLFGLVMNGTIRNITSADWRHFFHGQERTRRQELPTTTCATRLSQARGCSSASPATSEPVWCGGGAVRCGAVRAGRGGAGLGDERSGQGGAAEIEKHESDCSLVG